jgi:hypothetical protein
VLFFFEVGFFVLALGAVALAELWGRGPTLALWALVTALSWLARPLVQRWLGRRPAADQTEARWRRELVINWRRFNMLLLGGLVGLTLWWGLGSLASPPAA